MTEPLQLEEPEKTDLQLQQEEPEKTDSLQLEETDKTEQPRNKAGELEQIDITPPRKEKLKT